MKINCQKPIKLRAKAPKHRQHKPGDMNKTEARYAAYLQGCCQAGTVHRWWFEAVKLRVAYDDSWIVIDFMIQLPDGTIEFHDVKGGPTEEDATQKEKVVADLFPFRIVEARWKGNKWILKEIRGASA